jgi:dTDP-4-dehydrorhamnose reductase
LKILLTGRTGQVGSALERALAPMGKLRACSRQQLDLSDLDAIRLVVRGERPDVIVNAAAYTAVDRAEQEREAAFDANTRAVETLASEAKSAGSLLVHFSTDFVFDGEKTSPYVETDVPHPLNVYGESKLAGERAIASSDCRHLIFRTSWVYAPGGRNFMHAVLAAARTRPELRVVDDQHGAPTSSIDIAMAVASILAQPDARDKVGLYHLTADGETTWHGFAKAFLEAKGIGTPLVAIRSEEYASAARRPRNSRLDNSKLTAAFGVRLRDWRDGLAEVLRLVD